MTKEKADAESIRITAAQLYGILDLSYVPIEKAPGALEQMIEGGVNVVQLRGKNWQPSALVEFARKCLTITEQARVPLIVNDYAEIARHVHVQGVHVGQEDDSIATVRATAARPIVVGKSTHSLEQAMAAEEEGADYIGFGPIFATPTKPEYQPVGLKDIQKVHDNVAIPIFCIGGIKLENLPEVIAAGARRVAIVSGLLQAIDPADYARRARTQLDRHSTIENSPQDESVRTADRNSR